MNIEPIHAEFGARIAGVDLSLPLAQSEFEQVDAAINRYSFVLFEQQRMTDSTQLEFSRCFDPVDRNKGNGRTALIAPTPGEEHTFGLFMVIEFLRRAGWHCFTGAPPTRF